jgi:hypothetical protein
MTELYKDDVTGDLYKLESDLHSFQVVADGIVFDEFDVHESTMESAGGIEATAEKLHELVNAWEDQAKEHRTEADR